MEKYFFLSEIKEAAILCEEKYESHFMIET